MAARFGFLRSRTGDTVSWRLLTTNNRDLGRAPGEFPDRDTCRTAASWVREHAAELRVTLTRTGSAGWRWRMSAGDLVVAVSSRDYQRRIQAKHAAEVVLVLLAEAEMFGMQQAEDGRGAGGIA
ncbi:hypothetical protein AB0M02_33680 [Actinoplanes sp. NPDC051861]|uniref:hypothetical protein n=1 Tax=Actinoplanes sp. NPDC051861 TaxID=3155170 RepID=UPI003423465E